MKPHLLLPFFIALMLPGVGNILANDNSGLAMTPLPPGPILLPLADMCAWRILFSYGNGPAGAGNTANAANAGKLAPGTKGLPQMVSVVQTKPLWHTTIVTMDGKRIECWGEGGDVCYLILGAGEKPTVLMKHSTAMVPELTGQLGPNGKPTTVMKLEGGDFEGGPGSKYLFSPGQGSIFPDMDWLSPQTYVGLQQGALVFREQGSGGAEAQIKADTRFPVSWTKGNEVRTFQLLPAPQDTLVLPPDVARVAAEFQQAEAEVKAVPPLPIIPPIAQPPTGNAPDP